MSNMLLYPLISISSLIFSFFFSFATKTLNNWLLRLVGVDNMLSHQKIATFLRDIYLMLHVVWIVELDWVVVGRPYNIGTL